MSDFVSTVTAVTLGLVIYDGLKWLVMAGVPRAIDKLAGWQLGAIDRLKDRT
jgi:hypothetical protein